jgi:hypothetical protein
MPAPETCPHCGRAVESVWLFCPDCEGPLRGPQPLLGPRGRALLVLIALALVAVLNGVFFLALAPFAHQRGWVFGVCVLALGDFGLAAAFWVYYRSMQTPGSPGA